MPLRIIPLLLLLLLAAPNARAVALRPPPPPPAPNAPTRLGLDATLSGTLIAGASLAAGVRARVRSDPFQFEVAYDRDLSDLAQPDLRWLLLGGGGLARELAPGWDLFGSFLLGAYGVAVRDAWGRAWQAERGPAVGARVGVARRVSALRLLVVEPTLGLHATFLYAAGHRDPYREIEWGGPSAAVTLSVGLQTIARATRDGG